MVDIDSQCGFSRSIFKAFPTTDIIQTSFFLEDCFRLPSCGANSVVEMKGETDLAVDTNTVL